MILSAGAATPALATSGSQDQGLSCSGSCGDAAGNDTGDSFGATEGDITTYPDPGDTSVKEVTQTPDKFTTREQGSDAAKNDCGCTKGGSDSTGATGGDMGY